MKIRVATLEDIPMLVELGQQFILEAPNYSGRTINIDVLTENFKEIINGSGCIFIAELGSFAIGGIVCSSTKDWFDGQTVAFEQVFYVKPEYRATNAAINLLSVFIEWAELIKADRVQVGTTTGIQTKGCLRLYKKFGFREHGIVLDMELGND